MQDPPRRQFSADCVQSAFTFGLGGGVFGAVLAVFGSGGTMSLSGINGEKVPLSYYCRSMSRTAWRQGRSFGLWGFYFGGVLAVIEKRRGKNDYLNPFVAGAVSACMPTGMAMGMSLELPWITVSSCRRTNSRCCEGDWRWSVRCCT
eukprot:TRINITY_DN57652_c0_g1_i2.p1 TRINITY_DN57652_c0_g1~~TRINITY_DN57652_c0_g1_i2.p1  ORF type:complete len:147 (-),score=5.36 TRINITY_DN57652_c0_g1_i2:200-640(-)